MATWSVYLVRCGDGSLYTGITTDVERRLGEHRAGRGAKALRGRAPLELVTALEVGEHGTALRVEHRFKRLSKARKEELAGERAFACWVVEESPGTEEGA